MLTSLIASHAPEFLSAAALAVIAIATLITHLGE